MNLFQTLLDNGYFPVPCLHGSKRPLAPEWQNWRMTEDEAFALDTDGKKRNLGVICGNTGLLALDIDVDDKEILDSLPLSNVIRRGSKGELRFFRVDSNTTINTHKTYRDWETSS